MSSASSTSRSATAGRSRSPTSGCATATPGRSRRPEGTPLREARRAHRDAHRRAAQIASAGYQRSDGEGRPYDTPVLGYGSEHLQHAAPVERASGRVLRLRGLQHRRLLRGRRRTRSSRRPSPRFSIPTTTRCRASDCACSSSTSSSPARCRTCCTSLATSRTPACGSFHKRFAVQLNDTHPSIGVAELMRLLVDERDLDWDEAWEHHRRDVRLHQPHPAAGGAGDAGRCRCSPTRCPATWRSSTRSTAASSTRCAPRFPGDEDRVRRMSLIDEDGGENVRMAHLATVGSHAVNGVARCTRSC